MTHEFPVQVYYEDTDMGGIVYHANYLRYIERARSDWVRKLGNDQNAMRDAGLIWVVQRIEADYLAPAKFEDELVVETEVEKLTGARLTMRQLVRRGDTPLFKAVVTAVCVTAADGRPTRLPAEIRALL
ncbi:tol-pal system-associated acyl-CoA thioesterase [Phaeobacter gallaeciensis]|jgi:acyl-CoA thioester hydrolase|uniref:tol-pal system-associated acyl-CoA thioesterase n=1 Tax=Phaeobacter gallaeciensis TaxID=60890 RepID=UPI00237FACCA|nr:tol-pal system-associated acyl-CoA thioesterase [Phaeobacter gallaeciensis]MDE4190650.1 tol-pal system-associated acyl-CoA thioesterase [Phaeobacter gallaeciensis]MDE4197857.1 tol-pal system-associated acyl-CoA thioesterase [Phaeobacter gallaeciensis]MDE4201999.1 tol-pal system-associated acyl-CoA thioesterase [Phaeobacter gallaeciensis]MDE4206701.1 tol-pal system-associated acyl-CoA thioesterase [Phaeobacter gallaeciensis]MDE4215069.1 tol-pal system-associated acyl-CoA thioesterase [Phaeob